MIKVIAFDLGGVYFSHGSRVAAQRLTKEYGYDAGVIKELLSSEQSLNLRKGLLEDKEFWEWAGHHLPKNYNADLIKKIWYESYVLDEDIAELVRKLKPNYKLVIFSGNVRSRVGYLEAKYHFRKNFDEEVYSYDHKSVKPEKAFVEAFLTKVNCLPEEILYIDDKQEHVAEAVDLGINVVIYNSGEIKQLYEELKKYNIKF